MMKIKILIAGIWLVTAISGTVLSQETKVGYTNVELLLSFMPESRQVEKTLNTYGNQLTQQVEIRQINYQSRVQEYYEKKEANAFKDGEEEAMIKEIQGLEKHLQEFTTESEAKLLQKQAELMKPIMDKLQEKIDEVAREGNFTYILNQTSGMNILYGIESMDVTDELAAKLGIAIPGK